MKLIPYQAVTKLSSLLQTYIQKKIIVYNRVKFLWIPLTFENYSIDFGASTKYFLRWCVDCVSSITNTKFQHHEFQTKANEIQWNNYVVVNSLATNKICKINFPEKETN